MVIIPWSLGKNEIQNRKEKSSGKTHKEMTLKLFKLESLNVP